MSFNIITIFPKLFDSFKNEALIARTQAKKIVSIHVHNLRDYAKPGDAHRTVDDRPYGGGAGMVLMAEPIAKALAKIQKPKSKLQKKRIIVFSPKGKKFNQAMAKRWSKLDQLIIICGRYEGIDERVSQYLADEEGSIGDYVLFGGEVPAMVVMEAVTRLLPGAIGKQASLEDESFKNTHGIVREQATKYLEYPHYTRPEVFDGHKVPPVLLSGNHAKIEEWRKKKSKLKL